MTNYDKRQEIDGKVTALVRARFGRDYRAAFARYDADESGAIEKSELNVLLSDAEIGSALTRWA
ncbi:polyketide partial : [Gemmata massiliana]|uniref:Polyketide partial n=1 Tax=Gemmata massiliana TaxID=1210884 RepID=A0A6P2D085_9BACT|nr:hypothetical protein [Gemmata massiliana]VTR92870.1 polyketide partial : [Gemmata massiliana]